MPPVQLLLLSALLFGAPLFLASVWGGSFNAKTPAESLRSGFGLTLWAERNLLLVVPVALISLHVVMPKRHGMTFYGHGAVVFYQSSFVLSTGGAAIVLGAGVLAHFHVDHRLLLLLPALWMAHLLRHLRGAYLMSWAGTVVRTVAL